MKKLLLLGIIIFAALVYFGWLTLDIDIGAGPKLEEKKQRAEEIKERLTPENVVDKVVEEVAERISCSDNGDCSELQQCIDGRCGKIEELYSADCENKCNYAGAQISTSDGQSFTLKKGQGSYTLAGAIEWKLMSIPDYCQNDNFVVPIKLLMKQAGEVIAEKVVTTKVGAESEVITHLNIPGSAFTLTVDSIDESC